MSQIFFLIFSYLLGSIPSGFIFTKIFAKKNILEIGWKKTSGSNVFKNVGFLPGVLTGIFDIGKGSLAVFLAKNFGASISLQSLCGFFAILGHNWSIFLKFSGGRGIGTFLGALLILAPKIVLYLIIPIILLVFIFDTSLLTIFFLLISFFLTFYFEDFEVSFYFIFLSFFPIFLKRLSPIREIVEKDKKLIIFRLLFDDDFPHTILKLTRRKNLTK